MSWKKFAVIRHACRYAKIEALPMLIEHTIAQPGQSWASVSTGSGMRTPLTF